MLKMNYKKTTSVAVSLTLAMQVILPAVSLAQTSDNGGLFCSKMTTVFSQIDQRMATRQAKLVQFNSQRQSTIASNESRVDAQLAQKRTNWSADRAKQYAALEAKTKTEQQKQAVATFKTAMEAAIATRQAGVNTAVSTFRTGLDQNIATRNTAIKSAITAFNNSTSAAQSKAEADCSAKVRPLTIAKTYRASMMAARNEYANALRAIEKINVRGLVETRRVAVKKAVDDFQTSAQQARATLKVAFGESQ